MKLIIPENYDPVLTVRETQEAIKYIRDTFQYEFGKELNLSRISAPLYVTQSSGLMYQMFIGIICYLPTV